MKDSIAHRALYCKTYDVVLTHTHSTHTHTHVYIHADILGNMRIYYKLCTGVAHCYSLESWRGCISTGIILSDVGHESGWHL